MEAAGILDYKRGKEHFRNGNVIVYHDFFCDSDRAAVFLRPNRRAWKIRRLCMP